MKKQILSIVLGLILQPSLEIFAQFPLQVGNRWDYTDCWWNPIPESDCDTVIHYVVSDTLLSNGKVYYMIRPMNYYFFMEYMRVDSSGIYYYDTHCDKEWLYYSYNLPVGEYINVGDWWTCDTTNSAKVYKILDTTTVFFGDTVRMMKFFYFVGLDNDYTVSIIPDFGFVEWDASSTFANYNMNLKGCILSGIIHGTLTSVKDEKTLPNEFSISQNFPNPFNPSTNIQYAIGSPENGTRQQFVTLKVYDVLGNEIVTLVNEEKEPGIYNVEFRTDNRELPSGVYFYRIEAGSFRETKKMVLMR